MGGLRRTQYGDADAYGHRKKASVAESLADEIKRRTGEETIASDLTYDLRSGDPDFVDKLVGLTFGNMAYDAILDGKTGLMTALVEGCYELAPIPDPKLGPRKVDVVTAYNTERYRPMYARPCCQMFCSTYTPCRSSTAILVSTSGFAQLRSRRPANFINKNARPRMHRS